MSLSRHQSYEMHTVSISLLHTFARLHPHGDGSDMVVFALRSHLLMGSVGKCSLVCPCWVGPDYHEFDHYARQNHNCIRSPRVPSGLRSNTL